MLTGRGNRHRFYPASEEARLRLLPTASHKEIMYCQYIGMSTWNAEAVASMTIARIQLSEVPTTKNRGSLLDQPIAPSEMTSDTGLHSENIKRDHPSSSNVGSDDFVQLTYTGSANRP